MTSRKFIDDIVFINTVRVIIFVIRPISKNIYETSSRRLYNVKLLLTYRDKRSFFFVAKQANMEVKQYAEL